MIDAADSSISGEVEHEMLLLLRHSERLRLRLATRRSTIFDQVSTALLVDTRVIGAGTRFHTSTRAARLTA